MYKALLTIAIVYALFRLAIRAIPRQTIKGTDDL